MYLNNAKVGSSNTGSMYSVMRHRIFMYRGVHRRPQATVQKPPADQQPATATAQGVTARTDHGNTTTAAQTSHKNNQQ